MRFVLLRKQDSYFTVSLMEVRAAAKERKRRIIHNKCEGRKCRGSSH